MRFITRWRLGAPLAASVAALLAACGHSPPPPAEAAAPGLGTSPVDAQAGRTEASISRASGISQAATARAYRADAANHLYAANHERIYKGKLPPMLYAIGVLQVDVDNRGNVRSLHWMRAPRHAPEVIAEIERTVRAAAPFPAPARMGKVTYTDTWLWDRSGRFQLDTLTEGQL
jgi:protein TonB